MEYVERILEFLWQKYYDFIVGDASIEFVKDSTELCKNACIEFIYFLREMFDTIIN